jgi:hypothetical protein
MTTIDDSKRMIRDVLEGERRQARNVNVGPLNPGPLNPGPLNPGPLNPGPLKPVWEDGLIRPVCRSIAALPWGLEDLDRGRFPKPCQI